MEDKRHLVLLVGGSVISWLVHHQWGCPSAIEEALGYGRATAAVGRVEHAIEVLE
jgi:hypothetical protein